MPRSSQPIKTVIDIEAGEAHLVRTIDVNQEPLHQEIMMAKFLSLFRDG